MSDETWYCTYCGEKAVMLRNIGNKIKRKEYLCEECIEKERSGELKQSYETVDNL